MMDYFSVMSATRKREGFKGQRAIVIPAKILAHHFDNHPIVKQLYVTDIGYYPNALYHYRKRIHGVNQYILIYCVKGSGSVSYTHLRAHETPEHLVCRL